MKGWLHDMGLDQWSRPPVGMLWAAVFGATFDVVLYTALSITGALR